MPMIAFRYLPNKVSKPTARKIGSQLEASLRRAINCIRPKKRGYQITVEGDAFDIAFHQPDLRIYIFYHKEWGFDPEEKEELAGLFRSEMMKILAALDQCGLDVTVRFYERTGHFKVTTK